MQTRASKILYSNLLRNLSQLPKASSCLPSLPITHFSTIPNRPMRGDSSSSSRTRRDDPSEEDFLRNLNFSDKNEQENPHSRIPNRSMRPERRPMGCEGRREGDGYFHKKSTAGPEDNDEFFGSLEEKDFGGTDSGEKGGDQPGDTLFGKLDFGDIRDSGGKKAEETCKSTASHRVPGAESLATEPVAAEDADEIFKKMKETGLIPNAVAMLDGLCKDGLIQEAMKLFGSMREKGTIPEVVIYTAVVDGFCRAAKFDDAKRIFRKMQKNEIVPNAFSYEVLIQGLSRGKRLEDAVEFCMEMLSAGHVPNPATLTGLVDVFCKEKGAEEADGLVRSLRERGFAIDEKAVREHLDKKGPYSPMVWEAIFRKNYSKRPF